MPLLKTKLKNKIVKLNACNKQLNLEFYLNNIIINGSKRGCNGFVLNTDNNVCVYVDTEESCMASLEGKTMYRYADNIKDYRGHRNRFCYRDDLAKSVLQLLEKPDNWHQVTVIQNGKNNNNITVSEGSVVNFNFK